MTDQQSTQGPNQGPNQGPIPLHRIQRIDGLKLPLGTMPYDELVSVFTETKRREHIAHMEGQLIMHYLQAAESQFDTVPLGDQMEQGSVHSTGPAPTTDF